ncbi:MAG TPA: S-adenosylmethionine:tRNA ribosyltransferase-isomerase [Ktedonobacteraceae bacterium]|nr:S-adenosylmethionine:tRNA ribosyltransferase-isomerase [Ktedonobacteraceae bacterium]
MPYDFELPTELEAGEPPEERGLARDEVRLMISYLADNRVAHTQFRELPDFLQAGDLLVINTSGTMNAALHATRRDGTPFELHLSTHLPANMWIVEVRQPGETGTKPFYDARAGETLQLPGRATVTLHVPYSSDRAGKPLAGNNAQTRTRLWIATLQLPSPYIAPDGEVEYLNPLQDYLARYGFPIRYSYVKQEWPASYYQTVYATEMGSAEMPSAGRAFTPELITRLVARGVQIAPLILHTGVASLEDHEPPYEEYYRVPLETAQRVNTAHLTGKRIIAVGTTVVRALETVTDSEGTTHPGEGWTSVIVTPQRGIRAVNGMLTGLHEPRASHLSMLEALAGLEHLKVTYAEALREHYLWHEFGDLHLILP